MIRMYLTIDIIIRLQLHIFMYFFFFNVPAITDIYTLSLHDALPILLVGSAGFGLVGCGKSHSSASDASSAPRQEPAARSEEHTSELQSRRDLVCRLLLEKKKRVQTLFPVLQLINWRCGSSIRCMLRQ